MGARSKVKDISLEKCPDKNSLQSSAAAEIGITGLKHICSPGSAVLRRAIWLVLLLAMSGIFAYQIRETILCFAAKPTTQSSSNVYYQRLPFPAVTFCNQNSIRLSNAMRTMGWPPITSPVRSPMIYEVISTYTRALSKKVINTEEILQIQKQMSPEDDEILLGPFYREGAHTRKDMIKSCVFNGEDCKDEWFEAILTDSGLCYRFNANRSNLLATTLHGKKGGLQVELNFEQYEYTKGRSDTAGVYLLIQDQDEMPNLVLNTATAVTSGYHTSIALRLIDRTSYGEELGRCGRVNLASFPKDYPYTRSACELDCLTRHINKTCKCVDFYMPAYNGVDDKMKCRLKDVVSCVYREADIFPTRKEYKDTCKCPTPCHIRQYRTSMSQVKISELAASLFVSDEKFEKETFVSYLMGMMLREWVLLFETDSKLIDAIHVIVYLSYRLAGQVDTEVDTFTTLLRSVRKIFPCASYNSPVYCSTEEEPLMKSYSEGVSQVSTWYRPAYGIPSVELSVDTAHRLLTQQPFNSTISAQFGRNSSVIASVMQAVINDVTTLCNGSCNNAEIITEVRLLQEIQERVANVSISINELKEKYDSLLVDVKVSLGDWYKPWNKKSLNAEFYRQNYGSVDIFFPEMAVTEIKEKSAYSIIAMFSDIGGSLGLCLGGSILTAFEIVDVLLRKAFCCI